MIPSPAGLVKRPVAAKPLTWCDILTRSASARRPGNGLCLHLKVGKTATLIAHRQTLKGRASIIARWNGSTGSGFERYCETWDAADISSSRFGAPNIYF